MKQLRVGVIGTGRMGQRHCRVLSNMHKVNLVGVCDSDPVLGRRVAKQYDVSYFGQPEDLLHSVDAVIAAVSTPYHFDIAMSAIQIGVPVLVEKPIAETVEMAAQIAEASTSKGVPVMVGHIERFNPAYMELKHVAETMTPITLNLRRLSPFQGSNKDVDVVLDLMIHDTNLVLDFAGEEPISIYSQGLHVFSDHIDHATAILTFPSGLLVTMTASRITEHKVRSLDLTCREAFVDADLLNKTVLVNRSTIGEYLPHNSKGYKYRQESFVERISVPSFEPLLLELQHFVDAVLNGNPVDVTAHDGMAALRLAINIREACANCAETTVNLKAQPITAENL